MYVDSSQSLLTKETVAVYGPAPVGVKSIENVVVPPAGIVVEPKLEFNENSASPETVIGGVSVKLLDPVLVIVNVAVVTAPID